MAAEAGTAFVAIQGDFAPLGKSLRARGGIMAREGTKMGGAIGAGIALAAGAAFSKSVGQALDIGKANDVLSAQLGATGKDSKRLGKMAGDLYAGAYGDSIESVNDAVRSVHQNIGRGSEKDLKRFARNSLNLAQTFGTQADEVTRSVNALVSNGLAKNVDEAFNLITVGFQKGADKGGEFLDTLNEYSEPVKSIGLSARDFTAALVNGADNGVYSVDKIGDAVKEFSIRAVDGSKTTKDAFKSIGLDADTYAQKIAAGGPTARKATGEIIRALGAIKDPVKREAAGVGLFGSMFEDVGFKAIKGLDPASQALGKTSDAADKLDKTLSGNAKTSIEQFKRTALQGLATEAEQHVIPKLEQLFGILNDPKLNADQKFDKVIDGIADEISEAAPVLADKAAEIAPKVAQAFVKSFVDAGPWGQLLIGGALLSKMGGIGAFAALGRKTGAAYRGGFGPAAAPPAAGAPVTPAAPGQPRPSSGGGSNAAAAATGAAGGAAAVRGAAGNALRSAGASAAPVVVGLAGFKAVTESIKGASASDLGLLDQYATKLERVAKTGDAPGMRALAGKLRETAGATRDITKGKTLEAFATALDQAARSGGEDLGALKAAAASMDRSVGGNLEHLRGELGKLPNRSQAVDDAISRMSRSSSKSIGSMRTNVALNTRLIANKLGADTAEGKDALQRNFRAAATSIKNAMDDGTIAADQGLSEIRKLMAEALGFYGITPEQAKRSRINSKGQMTADTLTGKSLSVNGRAGHQRGGPIDVGEPSGDSVPALLERGEYVLNREAVKHVGKRALDRINFGAAPRFQTGGIVELLHPFNDPEGHGGSNSHLHIAMKTHAAIVALGKKLQAAGWRVSENPAFGGVGGMHAKNGYHYTGQAIDVNWPNAADEGRKIKEVLAQLDAGEISGGGAVAAQAEKLKRVLAEGLPSSPLKDVVQGGLDMVRSGAQKVLDDAASSAGVAIEGGEPSPGSGAATREQMVGWAKTALRRTAIFPPTMENVEKILTLAKKESSWIVDSMNNWDSNAKAGNPSGGLMHVTLDKVGGSMARLHDPVDNISTSIRYQKQRYGKLITFSPYRKGGLVEMLQQGGQVQGFDKGGEAKKSKVKKPIVDTIAQLREGAKVRLDQPGKKTSRNGRMTKRGWRPSGYQNKVKDVKAAGLFARLAGEVEQSGTRLSNVERWYGLTEESSTKQVAVQDATDQELIGHGLDWQEIARLRAEPEQMIELLNPPDIQHRVGEIDSLIALRADISAKLSREQQAGVEALQAFAAGIAERVQRAQAIRQRVQDNIRQIKTLQARGAELDEAEKRAKDDKARKRLRKQHEPERKRLARQLDGLRDETQTLVGSRELDTIQANVKAADGGGGMLRSTMSSLGKWTEDRDALAPNMISLPQDLTDQAFEVEALRKERREWLATAPPKIDVPAPTEPETAKAEDDGRLKELLEEWKRDKNLRVAVGDLQGRVIAGAGDLLPFAGIFHQGGVVPGPRGSEQVAIVQGGERVLTVDEQIAAGGSVPQVHVNVAPGMEWLKQFIDVRVENATRTQARRAGRGLPGGAS